MKMALTRSTHIEPLVDQIYKLDMEFTIESMIGRPPMYTANTHLYWKSVSVTYWRYIVEIFSRVNCLKMITLLRFYIRDGKID